MDRNITEPAIRAFITAVRDNLNECAAIALAADACATAGQVDKAVSILLGIEQLTYEANNLMNASSMLVRLSRLAEGLDPCAD